jgi:hypothetical protein
LFMVPEPAESFEKKLLDEEHDVHVDEQRGGPATGVDKVLCESCSRPNAKGDMFCTYCGDRKIEGLSLPVGGSSIAPNITRSDELQTIAPTKEMSYQFLAEATQEFKKVLGEGTMHALYSYIIRHTIHYTHGRCWGKAHLRPCIWARWQDRKWRSR